MSLLDVCYEMAGRGAASGFREGDGAYRAHEDMYQRKYRHWRGRSGRSYAFTVYAPADCPAYVDTVLIAATRRGEVLACVDLGPFPEAWLFKLRRRFEAQLGEIEFQIHVLAERQGDRQALIEDILPATVGAVGG